MIQQKFASVLFLGGSAVGKSSLIQRIVKQKFDQKQYLQQSKTKFIIRQFKVISEIEFDFFDTPSLNDQEHFKELFDQCKICDVIVLIYDVTNYLSIQKVIDFYQNNLNDSYKEKFQIYNKSIPKPQNHLRQNLKSIQNKHIFQQDEKTNTSISNRIYLSKKTVLLIGNKYDKINDKQTKQIALKARYHQLSFINEIIRYKNESEIIQFKQIDFEVIESKYGRYSTIYAAEVFANKYNITHIQTSAKQKQLFDQTYSNIKSYLENGLKNKAKSKFAKQKFQGMKNLCTFM